MSSVSDMNETKAEPEEPLIADTIEINNNDSGEKTLLKCETKNENQISEESLELNGKSRSIGVCTDTEDIGPCEPGTSILLEGILLSEDAKGLLIVNVNWRGKSYVGTLIDSNKSNWAPPRFAETPKPKQAFTYYNPFNSRDSNCSSLFAQEAQLCADPTVRTLRNGKRRYINQFENDLMSEIDFELTTKTISQNSTITATTTTATSAPTSVTTTSTQSTTTITPPLNECTKTKPKSSNNEAGSSASSVNDDELDNMSTSTSSSNKTTTNPTPTTKNSNKKAKQAKKCNSPALNNSSTPNRYNKKSKKSLENNETTLTNLEINENGTVNGTKSPQSVDNNDNEPINNNNNKKKKDPNLHT